MAEVGEVNERWPGGGEVIDEEDGKSYRSCLSLKDVDCLTGDLWMRKGGGGGRGRVRAVCIVYDELDDAIPELRQVGY